MSRQHKQAAQLMGTRSGGCCNRHKVSHKQDRSELKTVRVQGNRRRTGCRPLVIMRAIHLGIIVLIAVLSLLVWGERTLHIHPDGISESVVDTERRKSTQINTNNHLSHDIQLPERLRISSDEAGTDDDDTGAQHQVGRWRPDYQSAPDLLDPASEHTSPDSTTSTMHELLGSVAPQVNSVETEATSDDVQRQPDVITVDKIKGIDLASIKMGSPEDASGHDDKSAQLRVSNGCTTKTRYDRLIAQEMRFGNLSKPVIKSDGRFDNPFSTWTNPSVIDAMKFTLFDTDESGLPTNRAELDRKLPILEPNFTVKSSEKDGFRVTWIGHSTMLIQVDGLNILTDPMFSDHAGPVQYMSYKRFRRPACEIRSLPRIDTVLISHNHYDHLDSDSVKEINRRFGRKCRWVVPLGLGEFMQSLSVENYIELDWWQKDCRSGKANSSPINRPRSIVKSDQSEPTVKQSPSSTFRLPSNGRLTRPKPNTEIYFTPAQHWCRRGINDDNRVLWGSYTLISSKGLKFFFAGDTGYCSVFKEIGRVFGPFTGAAIPIGAYKPRWFLRPQHVDPYEAVQVHKDIGSRKSLAIHHSTFTLSHEHYLEPVKLLNDIMNASNGTVNPFEGVKHGASMYFS